MTDEKKSQKLFQSDKLIVIKLFSYSFPDGQFLRPVMVQVAVGLSLDNNAHDAYHFHHIT